MPRKTVRKRGAFPYIVLRAQEDGTFRPRFVPDHTARRAGFKGRDLRHPDLCWYTLEEAAAFGRTQVAAIAASKTSGVKPAPVAPERGDSVNDFLQAWLNSEETRTLGPATQQGYRKAVAWVEFRPQTPQQRRAKEPRIPELFGRGAVSFVDVPQINEFVLYAIKTRGLACGGKVRGVLQAAWRWGRKRTYWRAKLKHIDWKELKFEAAPPRIMVWTIAEIAALIAAADASGRASIGDAVMLGVATGQRQADRLALADLGHTEGRRKFKQQKTGAIVEMRELPALTARIDAARARVSAITLRLGLKARPAEIVICERTGRPYLNSSAYREVFASVRALAVAGSPEHGLAPCPSLAGKTDQDFRDTCVTWLARAECTLPEIASISGHSLGAIHDIMKHYLAITPELADTAIGKYIGWMDREKMVL